MKHWRASRQWHTRAFSLAELMIALVILGLGLLFIAAALPVGIDYTRQTVDMATAEAAGEYAIEQVRGSLRVSPYLLDPTLEPVKPINRRLDSIHRPRRSQLAQPDEKPHGYVATYEPFIKVRPLVTGNVRMGANGAGWAREIVDDAETTIRSYLGAYGGFSIPTRYQDATWEVDFPMGVLQFASLADNPLMPGLARSYPPIESVTRFTVDAFFNDRPEYPTYGPRFAQLTIDQINAECSKALDRRLAWTAFYRRISYKGARVDGKWFNDNDVAEAPLLYEIIIVVTRRVSANHRFPRQDVSSADLAAFEQPRAYAPGALGDEEFVGTDRLAPMPWLVVFDTGASDPPALPLLTLYTDYVPIPPPLGSGLPTERVIHPDFSDSPTLTFRCTPEVGVLLPVGSVFIPAANDQRHIPTTETGGKAQQVGFVPSAPDTIPIYEVAERPDETTVIVKNNGYYPWLFTPTNIAAFPCWVIPPCFVDRAGGQPVYERTSPIVRVIRRTVNLAEITP